MWNQNIIYNNEVKEKKKLKKLTKREICVQNLEYI